jgi:ABC-type polysaccharide/polyol phosphate export permease
MLEYLFTSGWPNKSPEGVGFSMWHGDYRFLLRNLITKDFKIRYRNMSLGVFWALLNPLVMMAVYLFVFTRIFKVPTIPHFDLYILTGIITFNFFNLAWLSGTSSLTDNAALIKRVPVPREIIPFASILSNCLHLGIQFALLLVAIVFSGLGVNIYWFWLPLIWAVGIVFIFGLSLITAGLNVYMRDTRYIVESVCLVAFWFMPIFYVISFVPAEYRDLYLLNPIAALITAMRSVLLEGQSPPAGLMLKFMLISFGTATLGMLVFRQMKLRFYDHL